MTAFLISAGLAVLLLVAAVPVAFAFGAGALVSALIDGRALVPMVSYAVWQIASFSLLALPLFIMAGTLMQACGLADRLVEAMKRVAGRRGLGVGALTVTSCTVFGAISGSGSSAVAALGPIMIPKMLQAGYDRGYATALVACSSILALLIPPSIPMIIFAQTIGIPASQAFLSTVGPALLIAALLLLADQRRWRRIRKTAPAGDAAADASAARGSLRRSLPALLLPVLILGGIYGGFVTPTEAAALACGYTLLFGLLAGAADRRWIWTGVGQAGQVVGMIVIVLFSLLIFSRMMVFDQVPQQIADWILGISENRYVVLLMVNVFLLLMGMFIDDVSGTILAAIVLSPLMKEIGIDPIHFAAIVGTNLGLGNVTPPLAPFLFMAGGIAGSSLQEYIGPALRRMLTTYVPVVLLVTYLPEVALLIPRLLIG